MMFQSLLLASIIGAMFVVSSVQYPSDCARKIAEGFAKCPGLDSSGGSSESDPEIHQKQCDMMTDSYQCQRKTLEESGCDKDGQQYIVMSKSIKLSEKNFEQQCSESAICKIMFTSSFRKCTEKLPQPAEPEPSKDTGDKKEEMEFSEKQCSQVKSYLDCLDAATKGCDSEITEQVLSNAAPLKKMHEDRCDSGAAATKGCDSKITEQALSNAAPMNQMHEDRCDSGAATTFTSIFVVLCSILSSRLF